MASSGPSTRTAIDTTTIDSGAPATVPRWLGLCALALVACVFASNHIAARLAFDHGVSVASAVAARSLSTAIAVLALLRITGVPLAVPRHLLGRALVLAFEQHQTLTGKRIRRWASPPQASLRRLVRGTVNSLSR